MHVNVIASLRFSLAILTLYLKKIHDIGTRMAIWPYRDIARHPSDVGRNAARRVYVRSDSLGRNSEIPAGAFSCVPSLISTAKSTASVSTYPRAELLSRSMKMNQTMRPNVSPAGPRARLIARAMDCN